jgi:hypothetical protein
LERFSFKSLDVVTMAEIKYQDVDIKDVIKYFADGYNVHGKKVSLNDYFIDPVKGKIVLKLMVEDDVHSNIEITSDILEGIANGVIDHRDYWHIGGSHSVTSMKHWLRGTIVDGDDAIRAEAARAFGKVDRSEAFVFLSRIITTEENKFVKAIFKGVIRSCK